MILLSFGLLVTYLLLALTDHNLVTWILLVIVRYSIIACVDTLGEGLMVVVRRLEENAKEFFDEVDHVNIVGTYLVSRGFSRALCSTIGAYISSYLDAPKIYLWAAVVPLAMIIFSRETFYELPAEGKNDWREVSGTKSGTICSALETFKYVLSVKVIGTHFAILLLCSLLPIGDLAHRKLFEINAQRISPELVLLIYVYHSLITYGALFYLVSKSQRLNKKYLMVAGLALLLAASLPQVLIVAHTQGALLFMSTLFHLFSHLGHSILLIAFFSLYLPFVSRTFALPAFATGLVKACTLLQPQLDVWMNKYLFKSLPHQVFLYWAIISVTLIVYSMGTDNEIDRKVEESLILAKYHEARKSGDEEERKLFKSVEEFQGELSEQDASSSDGSGMEGVKHF